MTDIERPFVTTARVAVAHREHAADLVAYASSLLGGDRATAEDVVQEAFLRTFLTLASEPRREIALRPWLYRAVRNAAIDELRSARRRHVAVGLAVPEQLAPDAHDGLEAGARAKDVLRRVAGLPRRQRDALTLHALCGLDHDQVACAIGTTRGASRALVHRARATLGVTAPAALA